MSERQSCPLCGKEESPAVLAEAAWLADDVVEKVGEWHPGWVRSDGACPACVQEMLLTVLLERGDAALHASVQSVWPLDAEAAFGALPTPLRMHADPRFTGRGVTIAFVDSGFFPHPDLIAARNRIRAWADVGEDPIVERRFSRDETPRWPGWDARHASQWHGLMTSVVAAGDGHASHGLYRGLAPDADVVLVQARRRDGSIDNASIARALRWIRAAARELGVRVVNLSVAGDPVPRGEPDPVAEEIEALVSEGVVVVAASGNDGVRRLVPPATAPYAITVGGLDDRSVLDESARAAWHSNFGASAAGAFKPELCAPSIWVVAPVLPGSEVAREAEALFEGRARGAREAEPRIAALKLVTPRYQHVEGTSFAAPVVGALVACMLEANPALGPGDVRRVLADAAERLPDVPFERQGAGAVDAGRTIARALRVRGGLLAGAPRSPEITRTEIRFVLGEPRARRVSVLGSWQGWSPETATAAAEIAPGVWQARRAALPPGTYAYKFLADGDRWIDDVENPRKVHDGHGGFNSVLDVDG